MAHEIGTTLRVDHPGHPWDGLTGTLEYVKRTRAWLLRNGTIMEVKLTALRAEGVTQPLRGAMGDRMEWQDEEALCLPPAVVYHGQPSRLRAWTLFAVQLLRRSQGTSQGEG